MKRTSIPSIIVKCIAVIALATLALTGCGTKPSNPQQAVFEVTQSYELALSVAVAYDALPDCTPGMTVCSTRPVRQQLKDAKDKASPAILAAQNAVRDPNFNASTSDAVLIAAQQAVEALAAITATLPVAAKP